MKIPALNHTCNIVLVLPLLLALLQTATAQKNGIDIYSLTVDSKVSSRFARTVITSRVVNRADEVQEATFQMELPKTAFITNFSMIIDGVTYPGNIKKKAAAQEGYSAAVGRGENAALVKTTGRKTEEFQVSVSVAAAAKVTFELVYEELLKRHLGAYELLLKVRPQQLVKHLQIDIHIFEPQGISFVETESTFITEKLAEALTTSQNKTKAHIRFKPTLSQQQKSPHKEDTVLSGSFIIRYDVNRSLSGGSIQIENGYFVHYFAPEGLPTMPKNVVFVIDKSGSMSGRKIQQTREALIKILGDLNPKDQFNLISFSGEITLWKPSLLEAKAENVKEATSYAASIEAWGGTNINDALVEAVHLLDNSNQAELLPERSVSLIILLTDGQPTVGETMPRRIQNNVKEAIGGRYSLFTLGFGFDVSYAFLEKLALDNGGLARRIYEDSDSALQLQDFYQEVAHPLMSAVTFEYPSHAVEAVTQDSFQHLFKGSEIVVAGKLRDQSPDVLSAKVSGQMHMQNITFQVESNVTQQEEEFQTPKYIFHNFMERLWAYLTTQQYLEQSVSASDAKLEALQTQALNLSLKYNFVTPLTSMLVTKPEGQEQSQVAEKPMEDDENRRRNVFSPGRDNHPRRFGIGYTGTLMSSGQMGPFDLPLVHPTIVVPSWKAPTETTVTTQPPAPSQVPAVLLLPKSSMDKICVNIKDSQESMKLLIDPNQGIEVTGKYEKGKTGFSKIMVTFKAPDLEVDASPEHVVVTRNRRKTEYRWNKKLFSTLPGLKMTINETGLLLLSDPGKVTIGLLSWNGPGKGVLLLVRDTERFSSLVSGILGHVYHGILSKPPEIDGSKQTVKILEKTYFAEREHKMDFQEGPPGREISCWSVEL